MFFFKQKTAYDVRISDWSSDVCSSDLVNPTTLPRRALEHGPDRCKQSRVSVGDHQFHPVHPAGLEGAQERGPERLRLGVADLEAEDFPAPVGGYADRDDDGLGDHPPSDAGFAIGRVEEHVRVGGVREWPVPERGDVLVEVAADPGDLGLADPGVRSEEHTSELQSLMR